MDKKYPYILKSDEIPKPSNGFYLLGHQYRNDNIDTIIEWCNQNLKKNNWKYGYIKQAVSKTCGIYGFSFKNKKDYVAIKMKFL